MIEHLENVFKIQKKLAVQKSKIHVAIRLKPLIDSNQ